MGPGVEKSRERNPFNYKKGMLVGKFERDPPGRCSSFVWKTLSLHRQPNEMLCIMISLRQALDDEEKVVIKVFFSFLLFVCLSHSVLRNDTTNIPVPFKCKFYPEMPAAAMRAILRIHHAIRRRLFERWIALSISQGRPTKYSSKPLKHSIVKRILVFKR